MLSGARQTGPLIALIALVALASAQDGGYVVAAASVGETFAIHHQALDNAAVMALENVNLAMAINPQVVSVATGSTAQPDPTIAHRFAQQYWNGNDEAVRRAAERVTQLRPVLAPILHEQGIPDEVEAVVLVESAGQITALSPKGARGIWQFMPDTARRYGLTVNAQIDERLDVQKSTRAAARYLRDLHAQFGDWSLVLAAYNAGEKLLQNAICRAGRRSLLLLDDKRLLPAETRAYVPAVMAASILLSGNTLPASDAGQKLHSPTVLFAHSAAYNRQ